MKHVVPLIVMIIILIIFVDIASYKYLYTSSNSMEEKLHVIEKDIKTGNWKSAETYVNDLEKHGAK